MESKETDSEGDNKETKEHKKRASIPIKRNMITFTFVDILIAQKHFDEALNVLDTLEKEGLYDEIWQSFAVLLPVRSVGVMGDSRTYEWTVVLRAVHSTDGMTARIVRLPWDLIERTSTRIINEVRGINRVAYDISNKPPATIEWE